MPPDEGPPEPIGGHRRRPGGRVWPFGIGATAGRSRRTVSIGRMLAGLTAVPLVGLLGLWAWIAAINLGNAFAELGFNQLATSASRSATVLLGAVEKERLATFLWLSSPHRPPAAELTSSWQADDAAIAAYERGSTQGAEATEKRAVLAQLAKLSVIRQAIDADAMTAPAAFRAYSAVIDGLFVVYIAGPVSDVGLYQHTLAAIDTGRALEQFSRELALVAGAQAQGGRMSNADGQLFSSAVGSQNLLAGEAIVLSADQPGASLRRLYSSPLHRRLAALESAIQASAGQVPLSATLSAWGPVSDAFGKRLLATSAAESGPLAAEAGSLGTELLLESALAGAVGLVAIIITVLLMVGFGRSIRRELTGLHDNADELASRRLPALVERLRQGDQVDAAAESPPFAARRIIEVAKVANALSSVQRTAVDAAVGQANLRRGVSQVFLNLSLRNQSLLHRQLRMIDALERATDNPSALAELFRLDHLTTRMRRNAESLIILSGAIPSRGWRDPVSVLDVLRAAIAEVEDYVRVDIVGEPAASVVGVAANDVVHLIAELVENATAFSPPNTQVAVKAEVVGSGVAIEVEDRGVGLGADELAEINARLANPPGFDLSSSEQLGLFVVGQLASRHAIKVSLRESSFGGTTAIVFLPNGIIAQPDHRDRPAAAGADEPALIGAASPPLTAGTATIANPQLALALSPASAASGAADNSFWARPSPGPAQPATTAVEPPAGPDRRRRSANGGARPPLPFRVRQASMAPQLRDAPPGAQSPAARPAGRSAEETLALMAAFQDGWQRGREDDNGRSGDEPPGASDARPDDDDEAR